MPRKEELARMTPEQRERARLQQREARRRYWAKYPEKRRAERKRYREKYPERKRLSDVAYKVQARILVEIEREAGQEVRRASAALAFATHAEQASLFERINARLCRRLPPDERAEAASMLFLAIMDGRAPADFGSSDIEPIVTEMYRINGLNGWSRFDSLDELISNRARGEAWGLI